MIKIEKYYNSLELSEFQPNEEWKQVTNNPTAIASLLVTIDTLEEGEAIVIIKEKENKKNDSKNL